MAGQVQQAGEDRAIAPWLWLQDTWDAYHNLCMRIHSKLGVLMGNSADAAICPTSMAVDMFDLDNYRAPPDLEPRRKTEIRQCRATARQRLLSFRSCRDERKGERFLLFPHIKFSAVVSFGHERISVSSAEALGQRSVAVELNVK